VESPQTAIGIQLSAGKPLLIIGRAWIILALKAEGIQKPGRWNITQTLTALR
jgi:hypothetical protein